MSRLAGKVAIITGASQGMGEAAARLFAAEGASVVLVDVLDTEGAAVAADIGLQARYQHLDVRDEAAWEDVLEFTIGEFGVPDVLVNNAGVLRFAPILTTGVEDFRSILDINLIGPFLGMKVVGAAMTKAGRGSIVNISSTGGLVGMSTIGAYVSSKWGLRGLTKSAAIEFGPFGVRVNSVHPGGVATPMVGVSMAPLTEPPAPGQVETDPAVAAADGMGAGRTRSRGWADRSRWLVLCSSLPPTSRRRTALAPSSWSTGAASPVQDLATVNPGTHPSSRARILKSVTTSRFSGLQGSVVVASGSDGRSPPTTLGARSASFAPAGALWEYCTGRAYRSTHEVQAVAPTPRRQHRRARSCGSYYSVSLDH